MSVQVRRRVTITALSAALVAASLSFVAAPANAAPVGPVVTTQASPPIVLGAGTISDSATVTNTVPPPAATVTFRLYGATDPLCALPPVATSTSPVTDGDAQSAPYTPTEGGTYKFIATYDDGTNPPTSGACADPAEHAVVNPAPSDVATQASPPITYGTGTLSDSATVTTSSGLTPTGTVTFEVFGPGDTECDTPTFVSTNPVSGGDAQSDAFPPPAPGTYYFRATYNGDASNAPATGTYCADPAETTRAELPPTSVASTASAPITFGSGTISDSATVTTTSGFPATGSVTFEIYGPNDTSCSGDPIDSSQGPVFDGDAQSDPYPPLTGGVFRFRALYDGDSHNAPGTGSCTDPSESVTVNPVASSMTTQASGAITAGLGTISDVATVTTTSGFPPGGTVTFEAFAPTDPTCIGTPAFSSTNDVVNGQAQSDAFLPSAAGVYQFVAHYSGDGTNAAVDGACNDPNESTTVSAPAPPPASPTASASPSGTASPSGSANPGRLPLTLTVLTPTIPAGSNARLVGTGSANEAYQLLCYTRPSTAYFVARQGSFNASGDPVTFTLSLGRNTRCFLQYATSSASGASASRVINVSTVLSLSAIRTGTRTYVFQGRNLPRASGQLITLYRLDHAGNEIRTANLLTDSSGIYRLTRTFTGTGTFGFLVRTGQTLNNAAGFSRTVSVAIH